MDLLNDYMETPFRVTLPKRGDRVFVKFEEDKSEPRFIKIQAVHEGSPWLTELPQDYQTNVYIVRFAGYVPPWTLQTFRTFFMEQQTPIGPKKITICLWKKIESVHNDDDPNTATSLIQSHVSTPAMSAGAKEEQSITKRRTQTNKNQRCEKKNQNLKQQREKLNFQDLLHRLMN